MNLEMAQGYQRALASAYIAHANYQYVLNRVYSLASFRKSSRVILVIGPPRVGKSTVWQDASSLLVPHQELCPPGAQPIVTLEAANAVGGFFSQKHLVMRGLSEIKHPILGSFGDIDDANEYVPRVRMGEPELRIAFEKGLIYRQTEWLAVDEAHHCLYAKGKNDGANILDSFKCLGNTTHLVLLLFGSFRLLAGGLKSAHFAGRVIPVPFMHYEYSKDETRDTKEFGRILFLLDQILPVPTPHYLFDKQDYFHRGSIGCLGLLETWFENALSIMTLKPKIKHFSKSILDDALMLCAQRDEILADINFGIPLLKKYRLDQPEYDDAQEDIPLKRKPFARKLGRDRVGPETE